MDTPETHIEYAQRVGSPRVVPCNIDLDGRRFVWVCRSHGYRFNERPATLTWGDRCPISRLEEWRFRQWSSLD